MATPKDVLHIKNMARAYGVRPENLYEDSEPDIKALKKTHLKIMHQSKKLDVNGTPHVIMVYCGGHGAQREERQLYLVNSDDPKSVVFQLEYKLRCLKQTN